MWVGIFVVKVPVGIGFMFVVVTRFIFVVLDSIIGCGVLLDPNERKPVNGRVTDRSDPHSINRTNITGI